MAILVTATRELPDKERWIERLREEVPELVSLYQNIQKERTNVILGKTMKHLWGHEVLAAIIGDLRFALSPGSFFQVNPVQTRVLYETALQAAQLTGQETVIDAYCGTGTISLFLARRAKRVIGVEKFAPAVKDARNRAASSTSPATPPPWRVTRRTSPPAAMPSPMCNPSTCSRTPRISRRWLC